MEKSELNMAKLTFLGTGGGRHVLINQLRATGGFVLEIGDQKFHIDPGPGALVRAKEYGIRVNSLTGVLVSHAHIDHSNDTDVMIEAMTGGGINKKGILVSNGYITSGNEYFRTIVSPHHLKLVNKYEEMRPGDKITVGSVEITATKTKHRETNAIGFVFKCGDEPDIGYTSDGEYFNGQSKYYAGCRYLILNCLRPRADKWPEHMNSEDAMRLIREVKPKLAILQHFGIKMLRGVAEKEANWIQQETGIKTVAARDGMVLELNGNSKKKMEGLKKFLKD
jgi:phosphoribosyl 1,2-cyclic phosphodiesterase